MASFFPDGSTIHIATGLAAVKNITAISNANPAVCTSAAHGFANGDVIVLSCGWGDLDERVFRIGGVNADTFQLVGADTRDTKKFPAGQGANASTGNCRKVNGFTQIRQIANLTTSGGEPEFAEYAYLEDLRKNKRLVGISPRDLILEIGDDPTMAGYKAAKAASDSSDKLPLRIDTPQNASIYYNGYSHLDEMPTLNRGELMKVKFYYMVEGLPTRY